MNSLLYYLLQVAIVSAILYGYYHLVLRNKKFHQYNRFYLLVSAVLSILIPFLEIPVYFTQEETQSSFVLKTLTGLSSTSPAPEPQQADVLSFVHETHDSSFHYTDLLYYAYGFLAALILLKLIISLLRIRRLRKKNTSEKLGDINFVNTTEPGTPFSFFRWLFWHRDIDLQSSKGEKIFRHELFHIRQKHSLDIIFMELVVAVFWINPFFHLIKKELKAIHEFLADRFAINETEEWEYAELLLMQVLQTNQSLANPFFNNQIKRRIAMITNSKNTSYLYARKLLVLPLAVLTTLFFAFNYKAISQVKNVSLRPVEKETGSEDLVSKKTYLYARSQKIVMEADAIIFHYGDQKDPVDYKKALLFVNGEKKDYDFIKSISLIADTIIFYGRADKDAITIYGEAAVEGVIDVRNAGTVNTPPEQYFSDILSGRNQTMIEAEPVPGTVGLTVTDINLSESRPEEIAGMNKENIILLFTQTFSLRIKSLHLPDSMYKFPDTPQFLIVNGEGFSIEQAKLRFNKAVIKSATVRFIPPGNAAAIGKYGEKARKGVVEFTDAVIEKNVTLPPPSREDTTGKVFLKTEIEASFPGGETAWKKYVQRNLNMAIPALQNASPGVYTVQMRFIVSKKGTITGFTPLTKHGYGMEGEVIRIIQKGPAWVPAIQYGKLADAYKTVSVTFTVTNNSTTKSQADSDNKLEMIARQQRQEDVTAIKAIALNAPEVVYTYKGRTYVFVNSEATHFTEQDGTDHSFLLNGNIVTSMDEVNKRIKRNEVENLSIISPDQALVKYNVAGSLACIETHIW